MTAFTLTIETTNDAFQPDWTVEVKRLLKEIAHSFDTDFVESGHIFDINGNRCGFYQGPEAQEGAE